MISRRFKTSLDFPVKLYETFRVRSHDEGLPDEIWRCTYIKAHKDYKYVEYCVTRPVLPV